MKAFCAFYLTCALCLSLSLPVEKLAPASNKAKRLAEALGNLQARNCDDRGLRPDYLPPPPATATAKAGSGGSSSNDKGACLEPPHPNPDFHGDTCSKCLKVS